MRWKTGGASCNVHAHFCDVEAHDWTVSLHQAGSQSPLLPSQSMQSDARRCRRESIREGFLEEGGGEPAL